MKTVVVAAQDQSQVQAHVDPVCARGEELCPEIGVWRWRRRRRQGFYGTLHYVCVCTIAFVFVRVGRGFCLDILCDMWFVCGSVWSKQASKQAVGTERQKGFVVIGIIIIVNIIYKSCGIMGERERKGVE